MNQIAEIFDTILKSNFISAIIDALKFIIKIPEFIINQLSFLPSEILIPFSTVIIISIAAFLYKFFK